MAKRKIKWNAGDVFLIPLNNGSFALGQVLDLRWTNCVRCALYNEIYKDNKPVIISEVCKGKDLISLIEVFRDKLDNGRWVIVGNKLVNIPKEKFPNEQYKDNKWIGAKTHDGGLIEDFLNAFHGLAPWDDWYDPNYLDSYLVDISKKPTTLIYVKSR